MERKTSPQSGPMEKARELSKFTAPKTDPPGSWTGRPLDPYEVPVLDADDLLASSEKRRGYPAVFLISLQPSFCRAEGPRP